jgi:recombinational DNA repair protein RecR
MSIFESLLRFIDPIAHRERVAARRAPLELRDEQPDPEETPIVPEARAPREKHRRCRVCGRVDDTAYCLVCLADTMEDTS